MANPHPVSRFTEFIDAAMLKRNLDNLVGALRPVSRDIVRRGGETVDNAKARIGRFLRVVLDEASLAWSRLSETRLDPRPIVDRLVKGEGLTARKSEGKLGDTAYALLGGLLEVPAKKVRDLISR